MLVPLTPDHVSWPAETRRTSSWVPSSVFSSTQSIHSQCDFTFCSFSLSSYISFFLDISLPLIFPPLLTIIPFDLVCILSCHICYVKAEAALGTLLGPFQGCITHFFLVPLAQGAHLWCSQEDRFISGNELPSIMSSPLLWREIFGMY